MSEIFKLFRLQQIDSQLDEVNARLFEIERLLSDDNELKQAVSLLDVAKKAKHEAEQDLKFAEEEVRAQEVKIEHNQASLYSGSITSPKELEDLQAEAEALKRHLSSLEDEQLEQMERVEASGATHSGAEERVATLSKHMKDQHGELLVERRELQQDQERLEDQAASAEDSIPKEQLSVYRKTREKKAGLAVAKVVASACSACGNQLSQAQLQNARLDEAVNFCSTCKRILYVG